MVRVVNWMSPVPTDVTVWLLSARLNTVSKYSKLVNMSSEDAQCEVLPESISEVLILGTRARHTTHDVNLRVRALGELGVLLVLLQLLEGDVIGLLGHGRG